MWTRLRRSGAAADNRAVMRGMEAKVRTGVMARGGKAVGRCYLSPSDSLQASYQVSWRMWVRLKGNDLTKAALCGELGNVCGL